MLAENTEHRVFFRDKRKLNWNGAAVKYTNRIQASIYIRLFFTRVISKRGARIMGEKR